MDPLLRIKNLSIDFETGLGNIHALQQISFTVNRGEIVALVGESGSGKSVTALAILQLLPSPPAKYISGEIIFAENEQSTFNLLQQPAKKLQQIRGHKIAMIFQEPMTSLNPVLTCGKQVMETLQLHKKIQKKEAKKIAIDWFRKVKLPNPEEIFNRYPHQLSGGQKQRVMIAMAMCCEPQLLICDEPTTALDVTVQKTILELIKELQEQTGMGVIFITHDLGVVAAIAQRAVVMHRGKIVEEATVDSLFKNATHPYTKALLACRPVNFERGKKLPMVDDFLNQPSAVVLPEKKYFHTAKTETSLAAMPLLTVKNLSVQYAAKKNIVGMPLSYFKAVDDVSFWVNKGETIGLVGESGCGKTTLGRTILQLIAPASGEIIYNGKNITTKNKWSLNPLRKELQIVFQDPYSSLNPKLTIGNAIAEVLKVHQLFTNKKQRIARVEELLEKVGLLPAHFHRYPHEFSGGQRQRIVIARALALNPSFLVCDEPVSALDVSVQAQVLNLLNDLKKEFGFTVIFISHDLSVVRYISDRIMVMQQGKIVETGPADEIYFNPQADYTKKLLASIPKGIV